MSSSDAPPTVSRVSEVQADGSWFCGSCHSLNRAGALRCYSCRSRSPLTVEATEGGGLPLGWLTGFGAVALAVGMVLALTVSGRFPMSSASPSSASQIAYIQFDGQGTGGAPTATGADASPVEDTAEPTEWATPSVTVTPAPTATAEPTPYALCMHKGLPDASTTRASLPRDRLGSTRSRDLQSGGVPARHTRPRMNEAVRQSASRRSSW